MYKSIICGILMLNYYSLHGKEEQKFHVNLSKLPKVQQELYKKAASGIRCPNCTGLSVLDSETTFSHQIKNKILKMVEQKKTKDEIFNFFTERYGLWILREPPKSGIHLIIWLIPFSILIAGPLIFSFFWWYKKNKLTTINKTKLTKEDILKKIHVDLASLKSRGQL